MTKYTGDVEGGDGLMTLLPGDDPATVNWGGKWRTPTIDEINELRDNTKCTWSDWIYDYEGTGVAGYTVTSKTTGNSIFLPAAGEGYYSKILQEGNLGHYWSSTLGESYVIKAWALDIYLDTEHGWYHHDYGECDRYRGCSVRAVTK
jgi:hypothetical protein